MSAIRGLSSAASMPFPSASPLSASPLMSIGLIADLQFADAPDGRSFDGVEHRAYRTSLSHAATAVADFRGSNCALVLQVGDVIDGLNARLGTGHSALAAVLECLRGARAEDSLPPLPLLHVIGNHELLVFSRSSLVSLLALPENDELLPLGVSLDAPCEREERLYYSVRLPGGWRLFVLDAYDIAMGRHGADASSTQHAAATTLLRERNPNACASDPSAKGDYFAGLEDAGTARRFVPFNGGVGGRQRAWLNAALAECAAAGDSAIIALHTPMFDGALASLTPGEAIHKNLLFNYDDLLRDCATYDCVSLVISGHMHEGAFGIDGAAIAHVTLESPLTHAAEGAHAVMNLFADRIELRGHGAVRSRVVPARRRASD